jgi:hypothetical protein
MSRRNRLTSSEVKGFAPPNPFASQITFAVHSSASISPQASSTVAATVKAP